MSTSHTVQSGRCQTLRSTLRMKVIFHLWAVLNLPARPLGRWTCPPSLPAIALTARSYRSRRPCRPPQSSRVSRPLRPFRYLKGTVFWSQLARESRARNTPYPWFLSTLSILAAFDNDISLLTQDSQVTRLLLTYILEENKCALQRF